MKVWANSIEEKESEASVVELSADDSWAEVNLMVSGVAGPAVKLRGTPRQLRRFAHAIIQGCKRPDGRPRVLIATEPLIPWQSKKEPGPVRRFRREKVKENG